MSDDVKVVDTPTNKEEASVAPKTPATVPPRVVLEGLAKKAEADCLKELQPILDKHECRLVPMIILRGDKTFARVDVESILRST